MNFVKSVGSIFFCPRCGQEIPNSKAIEIEASEKEHEEARMAAAKEKLEAQIREETREETSALLEATHKNNAAEMNKQKEVYEDRLSYQDAMHKQELKTIRDDAAAQVRRLGKKLPSDLGKEGEFVDLETLKKAFPHDGFRSKKGFGLDGVQRVNDESGETCGKIALESKNASKWEQKFLDKMVDDKREEGAIYGVIIVRTFPSGEIDPYMDNNVIVTTHSRAVVIIRILRQTIIAIHKSQNSGEREKLQHAIHLYITGSKFKERYAKGKSIFSDMRKLIEKFAFNQRNMIVMGESELDGIWQDVNEIILRISGKK